MRLLARLLVSALVVGLAHAEPADYDLPLSHVSADGKTTIHSIPISTARALPEWSPESESPAPLSILNAIKSGKKWMLSENPRFDDFKVRSVTLQKMVVSSLPDRWYYKIDFGPVLDGRALIGSQFIAVILLDGTVVQPVVKDDN